MTSPHDCCAITHDDVLRGPLPRVHAYEITPSLMLQLLVITQHRNVTDVFRCGAGFASAGGKRCLWGPRRPVSILAAYGELAAVAVASS